MCVCVCVCVCGIRSRDNIAHADNPTSNAVWPLSALLRPLPLHCGCFRSTVAASAPQRPLSTLLWPLPLHSGLSPHYCGRFRSTAASLHTTAAALRTTAAAPCRNPTVFGVCSAAECTYGPPYKFDIAIRSRHKPCSHVYVYYSNISHG